MVCINTKPLKNISIYYKLKLQYYLKEACQYINIEQPKLQFLNGHKNSHYPYWDKKIQIGSLNSLKRRKKYIEPYINYRFKDYFSSLLWVLFHELGHHIQFIKYPKSTKKYWTNMRINHHSLGHEGYRKHLFESRPDKIAVILTKKYCPQDLTN